MGDAHQFNNIILGGRGGQNPGLLKISAKGFSWRKTGGGKVVDVAKDDVKSISWTRVSRSYQMSIRLRAGSNVKFIGFREQDVTTLNNFLSSNIGVTPQDKPLAVSGRNWGEAELEGNTLSFVVGGKQAFEICVADISNTQVQGKNDVQMEFHVDDTATEKDTLMEMTFYVPSTCTSFVGDEERASAQVFCEKILSMADVGPAGGDAVAAFETVNVLTPRGRYLVELHLSFLRLIGASDFKIQYTSVARLFVLPRSAQSSTYVVITLDPPIRKGQTFYPHIVFQYPSEEITELTPLIADDLLSTKYKDKLEPQYKGLSYEVFVEILRGLSGAGITKPGAKFRSSQEGYAVRAALKAEEGLLYPLEKSFFFLPKPPTLIVYEEIEYVEFERHGAAGTSSMSSKNFDLIIRLKNDQEHLFRNISRNEYHSLFTFISEKGLKILNFQTQGSSAVAEALQGSDDENVDPHLERIRIARATGDEDDSDEEDEDFVADKDDGGSPTDDSGEDDPDASDSGGEQKEEKVVKKDKKKAEAPQPAVSKKKKNEKTEEGDGEKKKKKKKKDPNAPKRGLSGFMFYSQGEREKLRKANPGMTFKEAAKIVGDSWKAMTKEEKEPFEVMSRADRERYTKEMAGYKGKGNAGTSAAADESSD